MPSGNLPVTREAPQRQLGAKTLQSRRRRITALRNEVLPALRELAERDTSKHAATICSSVFLAQGGRCRWNCSSMLVWFWSNISAVRAVWTYSCSTSTHIPPASLMVRSRPDWGLTTCGINGSPKLADHQTGGDVAVTAGDLAGGICRAHSGARLPPLFTNCEVPPGAAQRPLVSNPRHPVSTPGADRRKQGPPRPPERPCRVSSTGIGRLGGQDFASRNIVGLAWCNAIPIRFSWQISEPGVAAFFQQTNTYWSFSK